MGWLEGLLVTTGTVYLGALAWLWLGLRQRQETLSREVPRVSVIIAARDEAGRLEDCLQALRHQDYKGAWEVIVVDDRSTDSTGQIVCRQMAGWDRLRLVSAITPPPFPCPKKSALAQGIAISQGELLLFTDADCRPPPGWIGSTVRHFTQGVGLVAGYAYPTPITGFWQHLLALDNLAIGALSAGSFGMARPLSCSGRNLAYRRSLYDQLGGFGRIGQLIGGDDVYLMRLVSRETTWEMVYNREAWAAVPCLPPPAALGPIVQQKLRHAGKAGNYRGAARWLGVTIYLFHLALLGGMVRLVWQVPPDWLFLQLWGLRWLVDGILLWSMASPAERPLLKALPLLELCYIPYVLVFTLIGRRGWFRWKP